MEKKKLPPLYSEKETSLAQRIPSNAPGNVQKAVQYFQRDRQQKAEAWESIKLEYPELGEIKDLSEYTPTLVKAVCKKLKIPTSGVTVLGGMPYINKVGLLFRVHNDPRKVKKIQALPLALPLKVELNGTLDGLLISGDDTAVFTGVVEFENGETFQDIGTARESEFNGGRKMSTLSDYVMEMASTRAVNRALRLATGTGLASYEEVIGSNTPGQEAGPVKKPKAKSTLEALNKAGVNTAQAISLAKKVNPKAGGLADLTADQIKEVVKMAGVTPKRRGRPKKEGVKNEK